MIVIGQLVNFGSIVFSLFLMTYIRPLEIIVAKKTTKKENYACFPLTQYGLIMLQSVNQLITTKLTIIIVCMKSAKLQTKLSWLI